MLGALFLMLGCATPSSLRARSQLKLEEVGQPAYKPQQEKVRFDDQPVLLETGATAEKRGKVPEGLFDYRAANDHATDGNGRSMGNVAGTGLGKRAKAQRAVPAPGIQNNARFQRASTQIGAWPSMPAPMGRGGPYTYGAQTGRGAADFGHPFYGTFGRNYGPIGGPANTVMGMGSHAATVNPRGFGMQANMSIPWNLGSDPFMPSYGTPMIPGMPFPTKLEGYGTFNSYGMPPFTGNKFTAQGPYGPFKMTPDPKDPNSKDPLENRNTTLMGPHPFGPYGVSPSAGGNMGMAGAMGMMGGGMIPGGMGGTPFGTPGVPYGGPMGGGGMMGQMLGMGGLHPTYNPMIAMHHAAMMGGGQQTFHPPGLVHGSGAGYPEPDFDRYHSVILSPPAPEGGEAAAAP